MMEKHKIVFFSIVIIVISFLIFQNFVNKNDIQLYLDKSGPLIGTEYPRSFGFEGNGIKIAIIDTGIDYNHPDLSGYENDAKVIGGYDYIDNDEDPMDTNGHGTEVAGIIAADGNLKGIAPKAKILAYRVSSDGESVSTDLIIDAIRQAIKDDVDIINISLGINKTNVRLDNSINDAIKEGVVVVTAAGNNGPALGTIGSPGRTINSITVGASLNNNTSSIASTFTIENKQYEVFPMEGTKPLSESISAKILFGKYGRERDFKELDAQDSILLVERGSDRLGELVYFSEKEYNAAQNGAKALVVYNNQPGNFFAKLEHEDAPPNYSPSIPAVSLSREEGLELRDILENEIIGKLDIFYHPDVVALFSSRGPVSPFYIKPDLVAPGAFINTTLNGGKYNFTSGTSFAAPHVSGAAAILLQKEPNLDPIEIGSILATTADPVLDPYGILVSSELSGTGRLNLTRAFDAKIVVVPHSLIFNLSTKNPDQTHALKLKSLDGDLPSLDIAFELRDDEIKFDYYFENEYLNIQAKLVKEKIGDFEGVLIISDKKTNYRIPILIHITEGGMNITETNGELSFELVHPESWSYAKISVTNKDSGKTYKISKTPTKDSTLAIYEAGEYWIETHMTTKGGVESMYGVIVVNNPSTSKGFDIFDSIGITPKPLLIISVIIGVMIVMGIKLGRT